MSSPISLTVLLSQPSLCTRGSNLQFLSKTMTVVWAVIVSEEWIISATRRAQLRVDSPSFWTQCSKSTILVARRQVLWKFLMNFSLRSADTSQTYPLFQTLLLLFFPHSCMIWMKLTRTNADFIRAAFMVLLCAGK